MPDLERKELYTIPASSELFIADYQQDFGLKSKAIYQCPHCKVLNDLFLYFSYYR